MPFGIGIAELVLVLAVALLFFGAKRLPELASGMGLGIRGFKRALHDGDGPEDGEPPPRQPGEGS